MPEGDILCPHRYRLALREAQGSGPERLESEGHDREMPEIRKFKIVFDKFFIKQVRTVHSNDVLGNKVNINACFCYLL